MKSFIHEDQHLTLDPMLSLLIWHERPFRNKAQQKAKRKEVTMSTETPYTMVVITKDNYNFPTSYECSYVALNKTEIVSSVTLEFFYDLAIQRPELASELNATIDLSRAYVEGNLVSQLAAFYGLVDGSACQGPLPDKTWFISVSSLPTDIPNPNVNASTCFELQPTEDEECVSYQATMTGKIVGLDDTLDTVAHMAQQMNADAVTASTETIRVKFLGTELDYGTNTGRDNLPPAKNVVSEPFTQPQDNGFTLIGVAIVAGLCLTVIGLVVVIVRRRRKGKATFGHQEFQDEIKSELDTGSETRVEHPAPGRDANGNPIEDDDDDTLPESPDDFSGNKYNFDLGGWMKSELIGIHGDTTITAQPSRGPPSADEALSDSDNDSWAQTEATIGSLELRLDPIEAEV